VNTTNHTGKPSLQRYPLVPITVTFLSSLHFWLSIVPQFASRLCFWHKTTNMGQHLYVCPCLPVKKVICHYSTPYF